MLNFIRPDTEEDRIVIDQETLCRPSRPKKKENNILTGTSPITSWKNELTTQQIDAGLDILRCFSLDQLYDDNLMPNRKALGVFMKSPSHHDSVDE